MGQQQKALVTCVLVVAAAAVAVASISRPAHLRPPPRSGTASQSTPAASQSTLAAIAVRVVATSSRPLRLVPPRRASASTLVRLPVSSPLVRLPVSSPWALPPLLMISGQVLVSAGTTRRLLADAGIAIAPSVRSQLAAGADPRALASLLAVGGATPGPILVLHLAGHTATLQATSLRDTRVLVASLIALPRARRPRLLLIPAPGDWADLHGPPRPQPGQLASLVPIYQMAGARHGVDWRVLAAINIVETNLGTNMHVSSAGAVGWMQFMPATWLQYGVDANGDGTADPYDPYDAIETAAIYLEVAGARTDLPRAIFAYNHAWWYVNEVLNLAAHLPATFTSQAH